MKSNFVISNKIKYILLFVPLLSIAQQQIPDPEKGLVKWLNIEEAESLNVKAPKAVLIDVYTDWCGWCKTMIMNTYSNPKIASYINSYFYPVQFNAETHDTIKYRGETYFNKSTNKRSTHDLAIKLLNGQLSYPTTLFINNNFQFSLLAAGYLDPQKIEPLLVFTVENIFRTTPYESFKKYFNQAFWGPEIVSPDSLKINWYSMNEALSLQNSKPKKVLINIYTNWCNGCKVMTRTTFTHPVIAKYIRDHYYLVDFNAEIKDTIVFHEKRFVNDFSNGTPFHTLVTTFLQNQIILPSVIILDEKNQLIGNIPYYMPPENIEPVLKFYGDSKYLSTPWVEYRDKFVSNILE